MTRNPKAIPVNDWIWADRARDLPRAKRVQSLVEQSHKYCDTIVAFRQENLK